MPHIAVHRDMPACTYSKCCITDVPHASTCAAYRLCIIMIVESHPRIEPSIFHAKVDTSISICDLWPVCFVCTVLCPTHFISCRSYLLQAESISCLSQPPAATVVRCQQRRSATTAPSPLRACLGRARRHQARELG